MKKLSVLFASALVLISAVAFAQEKPADIPVFKGGEVTMEINLGKNDILPTLNAMLPLVSGKMGALLQGVSSEDLATVLKDVTQIEMIQLEISKPGVNESDIAGFYDKNLPTGSSWSRVFWQSQPKGGTLAVYVQGGMDAIYGYKVETKSVDGRPVKRAMVAKIKGKIDFVKLISLASKVVTQQAAPPAPEKQ